MLYVIRFGETELVARTASAAMAMARALIEGGATVTITPQPKASKGA